MQEALLAPVWLVGHAAMFASVLPTEVMRDDPDDAMRTSMRETAGVFAGLERRMIANGFVILAPQAARAIPWA